jgi:hypothetical protein
MVTEKNGEHVDDLLIWSRLIGFMKLLWFLVSNKRVLMVAIKTLKQSGSRTEYVLRLRYKRMDPDLMDLILKEIVNHNDAEANVVKQARDILNK